MTRVDFYQIESSESPLSFACRLIEKIHRQGLKVYVHTGSDKQAKELDDLLWTYKPERFVPHTLHSATDPAPVRIGSGADPDGHGEVLVNLAGDVPDFFSRFDRVTEVVPGDESSRTAARENYRFYRDRGYQLAYHQIHS